MSTTLDPTAVDSSQDAENAASTAPADASVSSSAKSDAAYPPKLARLLRLKVPVIAEMSRRSVLMARARRLATGMILEFDRGIEEHCRLLINNRLIATGEVVRVAEHFGLRILAVEDARARIESLGGES